jgi:hypothetical protein
MKLSFPALLDAGRRSFLIAGAALATALAFPAPGALARPGPSDALPAGL